MDADNAPRLIASVAIDTAEIQRSRILDALRAARHAYPLVVERHRDQAIDAIFNALADCGVFNRRHPERAISQDEVSDDA